MRRTYEQWSPSADTLAVVEQADAICRQYARDGYDLTLRQLYYQFVARDLIPNTDRSYKRLGDIVGRARMSGMLDWQHLVDTPGRRRSLACGRTPPTRHYMAECQDCDWETAWVKNGQGLAAQHHDRTGHVVRVAIEGAIYYGEDRPNERRWWKR